MVFDYAQTDIGNKFYLILNRLLLFCFSASIGEISGKSMSKIVPADSIDFCRVIILFFCEDWRDQWESMIKVAPADQTDFRGVNILFCCEDRRNQRERTCEDVHSKNKFSSSPVIHTKNRINAKSDPYPIVPLVL